MKYSTIITACALAFACAFSGCKYSKAAKGLNGDGNGNGNAEGIDLSAEEGSLSDYAEGRFEDMYTRCTDVDFTPVYFGFDSTVVPDGEMGKIDAVVSHLSERTDRVVVVEGNCDERGSNEYNMSLGENRAIIVRNYLVQNGIDDSRIQTRSYGEEKPAVDGHDESAYSLNRRAEFAIFHK